MFASQKEEIVTLTDWKTGHLPIHPAEQPQPMFYTRAMNGPAVPLQHTCQALASQGFKSSEFIKALSGAVNPSGATRRK